MWGRLAINAHTYPTPVKHQSGVRTSTTEDEVPDGLNREEGVSSCGSKVSRSNLRKQVGQSGQDQS